MGMVNAVYLRSVPTQVPVPIVKIDRQDASDLVVHNMNRVWSELTYLVRGITRGPIWDEVGVIADRIENVLNEATTSSATATIYLIRRLEPFTDETTESGQLYLHAGGIYTLYAQAL